MPLYSLYIINKAGGLIYQTDFVNGDGKDGQGPPRLSSNEYLVLAGTFHGIHAITANINPIEQQKSSGIQTLQTDTFKLYCFQTLTGIKFLLTADPQYSNLDAITSKIYEVYADYVMKNPFYTPEMPIRCDLFDQQLVRLKGI